MGMQESYRKGDPQGMALAVAPMGVGIRGAKGVRRMTDVPNIRGIPVEEGIAIARQEPHLIPSGAGSEGYYVGGPRTVMSKADLKKIRKDFDKYVAADPRGGDWYDRYRAGVGQRRKYRQGADTHGD